MNEQYKPPTPEQIDRLLAFLPVFQRPDFLPAWNLQVPDELLTPYMAMQEAWAPDLEAFHQAVYTEGFAFCFDWSEWQEQAQAYVNQPETLAQADLLDLCRLLTTHVRMERFYTNHLPEMVRCGHITRLLERLKEIRQSENP